MYRVYKKTATLTIHECSLRFEQQKVYVALGFEPLASITGLNVELLYIRFGSVFSTDFDGILSLIRVLQN